MIGPSMDRPRAALLFGKILKEHRHNAGLSQEAVAEGASLHRTFVGMIEGGSRLPTILTVWKLANSLEISLPELMAQVDTAYRQDGL